MRRLITLPRPATSKRRRLWAVYLLALALVHMACFFAWVVVLTPNTKRPYRPLGVQTTYAWGWVWINTRSGIYRHPNARWWGNTQTGKYRPEWIARMEGKRETSNGQ